MHNIIKMLYICRIFPKIKYQWFQITNNYLPQFYQQVDTYYIINNNFQIFGTLIETFKITLFN